jgi:hypothetical protein
MPIVKINGKDLDVTKEVADELNTFVQSVNQRVKDKEELLKIGDSFGVDTKEFKTAREAKIKVLEDKGFKVGDDVSEDFLNGALMTLKKFGDSKPKKDNDDTNISNNQFDNLIEDIFKGAE